MALQQTRLGEQTLGLEVMVLQETILHPGVSLGLCLRCPNRTTHQRSASYRSVCNLVSLEGQKPGVAFTPGLIELAFVHSAAPALSELY